MSQDIQIRLLDAHFSRFLADRCGLESESRARFQELVQNLSLAMDNGHSCLQVEQDDAALLAQSALVSAGEKTPLVLLHGRLYLHRYYQYESRLAVQLKCLAGKEHACPDMQKMLDDAFGVETDETNWQKKAAETALKKWLAIISGGPGTGKTTTVVKILGLLLQAEGTDLQIALAAPTGKAAMRLQESISNSVKGLSFPNEILEKIPLGASTLHRLLGVRRNSPQFRHNSANPLPWDVVVVDEASMVDLAMMSKVVDSLRPGARLILLGDKDQLASVESGAVLFDCIRSLPHNTVELKKSYRFDTGIKTLATAINRGAGKEAWDVLAGDEFDNVSVLRNSYFDYIGEMYSAYIEVVYRAAQPDLQEVFNAFGRFQVLCATRHGNRGVQRLNAVIESYLKRKGYSAVADHWYAGRPVLITANDYSLDLFNGDIGICLPDPSDGRMKVWFERGDGSFKSCLPYRIPRCETVYAMTIHKSQGSEFSEVVVILPEDESRLLNRQLVYTAVTRAKEFVHIVASKKILVYALQSDYPRYSGLSQMLLE
jgi:exodeoxyribonuclease V alpha subunit